MQPYLLIAISGTPRRSLQIPTDCCGHDRRMQRGRREGVWATDDRCAGRSLLMDGPT
jgi:hypothetical protein